MFPSSDVRVLGLPAGQVTKVEIDGDQVLVELAISDDIKVPAGAKAQIVPQSLIGERYIQLSPAYQDGHGHHGGRRGDHRHGRSPSSPTRPSPRSRSSSTASTPRASVGW